jgi:hypothetical protein
MGYGTTWGTVWGGGGAPLTPLGSGEGGPFLAAMWRGNAARIRPSGWTAPEGEFVGCMGSDVAGRRGLFQSGDSFETEQTGLFDVTKVLRARLAWRGPSQNPIIVRVTSAATGDYTITINGTSYTYSANTAGATLLSGASASIVAAPARWLDAGYVSVDDLSGVTEAIVAAGGNTLTISGAAIPANNGTHPIGIAGQGFIDSTEVAWRNLGATAGDGNNGSLTWSIQRAADDVTRIAHGLARLINEGSQPVLARALDDDTLAIEREDPDDPLIVTIAGNLSSHTVSWKAELTIDGIAHWSDVLDPRRSRDLFDVAALTVPLGAALHTIAIKLSVETNAPGRFEAELPALYVDALTFVETV